jgi:hypothetical protein
MLSIHIFNVSTKLILIQELIGQNTIYNRTSLTQVENNTAEIQTLPEMHHIPNKNIAPN